MKVTLEIDKVMLKARSDRSGTIRESPCQAPGRGEPEASLVADHPITTPNP
jgi:hypothetical protein